ncbi:MAG: hypothetical protein ABIL09_14160 [Gemmatimonadota bacterium]
MAKRIDCRRTFGWQGITLRVPEDWDLGKVDGDFGNGYARLDDAQIVRAEVEWRSPPKRGRRLPMSQVVDRYLETLSQKAQKGGVSFTVHRQSGFLRDKRWLEGCDYETFVWESDYRAYNLARACGHCGRIVLLRVLGQLDEKVEGVVNEVFRSLGDHAEGGDLLWSVYGMTFRMPAEYKLAAHELKSGHIQLTFEQPGHECRVHRLSMAGMLLRGVELTEWYPAFFRKQLRDFEHVVAAASVRDHGGLRVSGRPRSRWRQVLRPLPFVNPRPRRYLDGRVWHCEVGNRICIVEHLHRKRDEAGDLADTLTHGYLCHPQGTEADPGGHAELPADAQRAAEVGEERGG